MVLDKTGTITEGKPTVTDIIVSDDMIEVELLRLVASAEQDSEHPLAAAIVKSAEQRGLSLTRPEQFQSLPGHGLEAVVDGRKVLIGNERLFIDANCR